MDKEFMDYISGFTNVYSGNLTIGREKNSKGIEYVTIAVDGKLIYSFWHNPNKKVSNKPPKHTGGKPSYVKLMINGLREHTELSVEAYGFLLKLIDNIQWNTNLLVQKRNKKPLIIDNMTKITGTGRNKALKIIKELTEAQLLSKDKDGYKISASLLQKGCVKKNGGDAVG